MEGVIGRIDSHRRTRDSLRRRRRDINRTTGVKIDRRRQSELTQRLTHGRHQDLEDRLLVGKLNLRLRRVDIHIDRLRRDIKINKERRLIVRREHARISGHDGLLEIRMAHVPTVDKEILLGLAGRILGLDDEPSYRDQLRLCMYIDESGSISVPLGVSEDRLDPLFLCAGR